MVKFYLPATGSIVVTVVADRGGGVLVAISCDITSRQLYTCDNCELLVIELDLKPKIVICCSIYLPPSCPDAVFNASMVHLYALPCQAAPTYYATS